MSDRSITLLPYDTARCNGVNRAWLCEDCLRRTSPGRDYYQVMIEPGLSLGECRNYIEPELMPTDNQTAQ